MSSERCNSLKGAERQASTVLVGDDEPETRSFLETALRCQGYGVELAEDGHQVLDSLRVNHGVSAVLLNLCLAGEERPRDAARDSVEE